MESVQGVHTLCPNCANLSINSSRWRIICSVHLAYLVSGGELEGMVRSCLPLSSIACPLLHALGSIAPFETRTCRASLYLWLSKLHGTQLPGPHLSCPCPRRQCPRCEVWYQGIWQSEYSTWDITLQTSKIRTVIVIDEHGLRMCQYPSTASDLNLVFLVFMSGTTCCPRCRFSINSQYSIHTERALHMQCCQPPNPSFITAPVSGLALHEMTARCGILPMAVNVNLTYSFYSAYHALCTKVILHTTVIIVLL